MKKMRDISDIFNIGRCGREEFIKGILYSLIAICLAIIFNFFIFRGLQNKMFSVAIFDVTFIFSYCLMIIVTIKRVHDLNMSIAWALVYYLVPKFVILTFLGPVGLKLLSFPGQLSQTGALLSLCIFFYFLIGILFLSLKRGTKGPNKFGPDPLEVQHVGQ